MMKIGDFSRLGQVTVKTLRHYSRIGLLNPAEVDPHTGYRYYTPEQLTRLAQILALKDLDLSLDEIGKVLSGELSTDEFRRMLERKQVEVQGDIEVRQVQLQRIETQLANLERIKNMKQDVTIKEVPAQTVLAWRGIIPDPGAIKRVFDAVNAALTDEVPLTPAAWLALYHHDDYREIDLDFEIALPVQPGFDGTLDVGEGRVMRVRQLPAATMATARIHLREQADVREGNRALAQWVEENGYRYVNELACREAYDEPPLPDGTIVFETQFPVVKD